jgi:hypothetical protein
VSLPTLSAARGGLINIGVINHGVLNHGVINHGVINHELLHGLLTLPIFNIYSF